MNKIGEQANGIIFKYENPLLIIVRKIAIINAPVNKPITNLVCFFFLVKSSVESSLKFSFAIIINIDCECFFMLTANGFGLAEVGEFKVRMFKFNTKVQ